MSEKNNDAPDRIWINSLTWPETSSVHGRRYGDSDVEYIRADLLEADAAKIAEIKERLADMYGSEDRAAWAIADVESLLEILDRRNGEVK